MMSPDYESNEERTKLLKVWRVIAVLCCITQILNPILLSLEKGTDKTYNFPIQIAWIHENNFEFYLRNLLTSIAIGCLSYYNIRYTAALVIQMGDHIAFKHGVRMKIVSIASLIQVCLLLRFFWIWTANFFWFQYPHGARDYLTFEASFFVLSELLPFLIFCVVLTIRIMAYKRDYYEKILRETTGDEIKISTGRDRAQSDVSKSAMVNSLEPDNRASQSPGIALYEDPYSDNRPDGIAPTASRDSMLSRTISEVSDRRMSADFGRNVT
jgi:hypothetical protein